jgi:D-amino peptidase
MRVYISVDMEGIACVVAEKDAWERGGEYERARKWMTGEANAAIVGAFAGGADEVVISDSHGPMTNLLPEELHPDVWLVRGQNRPGCMMEGIEEGGFGAAMFIGYHAMAGTEGAGLAHSFSGDVAALRLNGTTLGESGYNAAYAGHFGVPVALVSGDDRLAAEVAALMPWAERVVVKRAVGYGASRNLTPQKAQEAIRERAKLAVERAARGEMKPLVLEKPIRLEVEFRSPKPADLTAVIPGVERLDGRSVAFTGVDMVEVNRAWMTIMRLG